MSRKRPVMHQLMSTCLGVGFVMGTFPVAASAADGPSRLGTVSYDASRHILAVPIQGASPSVKLRKLAPRQFVADFDHSVLARSEVQGQRTNGVVAGWSLDEMPQGDTVRLRLTLNDDVTPQLRCARHGNVMTLELAQPQPLLASAQVKRAAPVLPAVVVKHAVPQPLKVAAAGTRSTVAFPTAAPVGRLMGFGPLRADTRSGDHPQVLVATQAPAAHALLAHARAKANALHAHLLAHGGSPTLYPLHLSHRELPVATAFTPRLPAGLSFPLAAAPQAHHHGGKAMLGAAHFDAKRGCLVVPVDGDVDQARLSVVRLNQRWAYLDVPSSRPAFSGVRYEERTDKLFQRWVMAKRPGQDVTRLSIATGGNAHVEVMAEGHQLLIAVRSLQDVPLLAAKPAAVAAQAVKPPVKTAEVAAPAVKTAEVAAPAVKAATRPAAAAVIAAAPVIAPAAVKAAAPIVSPAKVQSPVARPVPATVLPTAMNKPVPAPAARPAVLTAALPPVVKPAAPAAAEVPAAKPAPKTEAPKAAEPLSQLDRPYYDHERLGLVLPYRGVTPSYRWTSRDDKGATLEVKGGLEASAAQTLRHQAVMAGWKIERATAGTARVALSFQRAADVVVAADATHHALLLLPQPRLAGADASAQLEGAADTVLEGVKLQADGRAIFLPYSGTLPHYTVSQVADNFAYVDFAGSKLAARNVQFGAPEFHPTLNYWLMSEQGAGVRLALALTQAGGPAIFLDRLNQRLVVEMGDVPPLTGSRTPLRLPQPWPGESHPTGYQPQDG